MTDPEIVEPNGSSVDPLADNVVGLDETIAPDELDRLASVSPTCSIGLDELSGPALTTDGFESTSDGVARTTSPSRSPKATTVPNKARSRSDETEEWNIETKASLAARYRPVKMHAKGGLGAVYQGDDKELGRLVALKRILPGREDDAGTRARFIFEAEVTGSLEHPGIVPVYGLSHYANNRPYYAMRFVRGASFTAAIDEFHDSLERATSNAYQSRAFRQLLRHFIDCCNALHYAHEKGVLHRDIKPDNIMLGPYGETLVVDWGLAKILTPAPDDPKETESTAPTVDDLDKPLRISSDAGQTSNGSIVGTPIYMSPEQALGINDTITPAADIYSLGAMLFKIVSNHHVVEGKTTRDVILKVREGQLSDLRSVAAGAPGALVSICKKATAQQPKDRYPTAIALANDLDRWLSDEAVSSHTETFREKSVRLLRRYSSQAVMGGAALALVALVSLLAALLIYNAKKNEEIAKLQARQFKGEAVERYRESRRAIDSWLIESSDALEYFPGTRSVRARLLALATEDYEKLAGINSEDPELELERARVLIRLGDLNRSLEKHSEAKRHYRDAIELLDSPATTADAIPPSNSLGILYQSESANARSRLALDFASEGNNDDADREYQLATDQLKQLSTHSQDRSITRYLGASLVNWANVALSQNQNAVAQERLHAAIAEVEEIGSSSEPSDHLLLTRGKELLGRIAIAQGRLSDAVSLLNDAEAKMQPVIVASPDNPNYLDAMASLIISRSSAYRALGMSHQEIDSLQIAVEHYRSLRRAVPDMPRHTENLSLTLTDLALVLLDEHRCRDAVSPLAEADGFLKELIRDYGELAQYQGMRAAGHDASSQVQLAIGQPAKALEHATQAILAYQQLSEQFPDRPDYYQRLAIAQSHYSQVLASSINPDKASDNLASAKQGYESAVATLKELSEVFPDVPSYRSSLAAVYERQGRFLVALDKSESATSFDNAIAVLSGLGDDRDPKSSDRLAWVLLTRATKESQDPKEATIHATASTNATPGNGAFRCVLAMSQIAAGQLDESAETLKPTEAKNDEQRSGREWFTLARWYQATGKEKQSRDAEQRGQQWYQDQAPNHPELVTWTRMLD